MKTLKEVRIGKHTLKLFTYDAPTEDPDWRDLPNGKEKYQLYLSSSEWKEKRRMVLRRCKGICERCNFYGAEVVHHLTYDRVYDEALSDLWGVCNGCHNFIHDTRELDPIAIAKNIQGK